MDILFAVVRFIFFAFLLIVVIIIAMTLIERYLNRHKYAERKKKRAARRALRSYEKHVKELEAKKKKEGQEREARNHLVLGADRKTQEPFGPHVLPRQQIDEATKSVIDAHVKTLYRKKLQGIRKDDYGNIFDEGWIKEKQYFHENVVIPQVSKNIVIEQVYEPFNVRRTSDFIEQAVSKFTEGQKGDNFDINTLTPYEFEAYCAELLNQNGWSARATAGSGDQGIDIIAEKDGVRAVFQVKKYTSPVGNKAVQEIIAGRIYASADMAFVVTNTSFTPSARALAEASDVGLLHFGELAFLDV